MHHEQIRAISELEQPPAYVMPCECNRPHLEYRARDG
jgi:hypothetical protein